MSLDQSVETLLSARGLALPAPPAAGGNYISAKTIGSVVYLSGVISKDASGAVLTGTVGLDRTIEEGYAAAQTCCLAQLSVLKAHLGSLDRIQEVIGVNGYVNAAPGFPDPPKVINGFSDLLVELLGERGRHVRAAIGVSSLPRNCLVEVQMTVAI